MGLVKKLISSPYTHLVLGLAVAGCGIAELVDVVEDYSELGNVGSHHGVVLIGILHALKGVSEFLDGIDGSGIEKDV